MKSSLKNVNLRIDWASHEAALYACQHWYYNPTIPRAGLVKIGAWEDGKLVGVLIFSKGANNNLGKPYGLDHTECCELTRIAFTQHKSPMTRILKIAINKFLRVKCPGLRLIITYADTQHHIGGIYQASNWFYLGETHSDDEYIFRGKRWHGRAFRSTFGSIEKYRGEIEIVKGNPKYRYALPLDESMSALIQSMSLPYPKKSSASNGDEHSKADAMQDRFDPDSEVACAISDNGITTSNQDVISGSTPTIALIPLPISVYPHLIEILDFPSNDKDIE